MIRQTIGYLLALTSIYAVAQNSNTMEPPSLEELTGDYVIMNYKEYEGVKLLADMKNMRMTSERATLTLSGFYMTGSEDFTADYDPSDGTISIQAGTQLLGGESGFEQYIYLWDQDNEAVKNTPIKLLYQSDGSWKIDDAIVLMSGVEGGSLTPYYFSNGTVIRRANATTENVSYVGWGGEQEIYMESRPSYVEITNNRITIYNMLQKDQFGYGCSFTGTFTTDGRASFAPAVIGQANDYTYKVLAGCLYDDNENKPIEVTDAGTRSEGFVKGNIDINNGTLQIEPMAIWAGNADNGYVTLNSNRSYFEFIKSVKISFSPQDTSSIDKIIAADSEEPVTIEYFNLSGQKLHKSHARGLIIRRTTYNNGNYKNEKVIIK